ncbi:MAG: hypothetical protein K6E85_13530 [Lachnospiraceae bacterium]|nr:hypothetical protein [Lachnospiraceae bacterium]
MKKKINLLTEIMMYLAMLVQMLYVLAGNIAHEIIGVVFFVCLVTHIVIKRKWFRTLFRKSSASTGARRFANIITVLLLIVSIVLMVSSMGVSRTLFPWFRFMMEPLFHRYLATGMLTLAIVHGGMHFYFRTTNKKKVVIFITLIAGAGIALGLALVPYLNRHLRKVEIELNEKVSGEKVDVKGNMPLVVYFTRVGNTDFDDDVDAVSGASLMKVGNELVGSNELLALMVKDALGCETIPITLIGQKYPSSYTDTVSVAGKELREDARPTVENIDISGYDTIILIYPIWWGTVPMPVATFLESNDFSGKTLHLLASQGSAGLGSSTKDIRNMAKGAEVIEGLSIYCEDITDAREKIGVWLKEIFAR